MTTECFLEVFKTMPELHRYIARQARRRSCVRETQEDCIQEAWLAISCAPDGMSEDGYQQIAHAAVYSRYWQEYKQYLIGGHREDGHETPECIMSDYLTYE